MTKKKLIFILKVVMTLFLFILFLKFVETEKILGILKQIEPEAILVGFIFILLSVLVNCCRLLFLLRITGHELTFRNLIHYHLIGFFFSLTLPGSTGGDIARGWYIYKNDRNAPETVSALLFWRFTGILFLVFLSCVAASVAYIFRGTALVFVIASLATLVAFSVLWTVSIRSSLMDRLVSRRHSLFRKLNDFVRCSRSFSFLSRDGGTNVILTICVHLLIIFSWITISISIEKNISFLVFFVTVPIISLLKSIPVTLGGVGLREGMSMMLFSQFGIDTQTAFSLAMMQSVFFIFLGIIGGVLFAVKRT